MSLQDRASDGLFGFISNDYERKDILDVIGSSAETVHAKNKDVTLSRTELRDTARFTQIFVGDIFVDQSPSSKKKYVEFYSLSKTNSKVILTNLNDEYEIKVTFWMILLFSIYFIDSNVL